MRQAYGGFDLVIPNDTLSTSSVMAFIKEISSNGTVNTIDVIFPAFSIHYIMNPESIRLLLSPLLSYVGFASLNILPSCSVRNQGKSIRINSARGIFSIVSILAGGCQASAAP